MSALINCGTAQSSLTIIVVGVVSTCGLWGLGLLFNSSLWNGVAGGLWQDRVHDDNRHNQGKEKAGTCGDGWAWSEAETAQFIESRWEMMASFLLTLTSHPAEESWFLEGLTTLVEMLHWAFASRWARQAGMNVPKKGFLGFPSDPPPHSLFWVSLESSCSYWWCFQLMPACTFSCKDPDGDGFLGWSSRSIIT